MSSPFVLNDLPDNTWSVCWPGYEHHLVNNPVKSEHLLEILFNTIKVFEARLAVLQETWSEDRSEILYISSSAWWQDHRGLSRFVGDFIVKGVQFETLEQAEHFKTHMEQRLAWKRLGGSKWQ
jgi:hypothetical protein